MDKLINQFEKQIYEHCCNYRPFYYENMMRKYYEQYDSFLSVKQKNKLIRLRKKIIKEQKEFLINYEKKKMIFYNKAEEESF